MSGLYPMTTENNIDIKIHFHDTSYIRLQCLGNVGILESIGEYFSFFVSGYRFQPKYKAGVWDGKIRMLNLQTRLLPFGLLPRLIRYLSAHEIEFEVDDTLKQMANTSIIADDIEAFCVDDLKLPFEPYDYQVDSVLQVVKNGRRIIKSPTGSGKSLIQYIASRWLLDKEGFQKILITVPTVNLITQLKSDFEDYAQNDPDYYKDQVLIIGGDNRVKPADLKKAKIVISTWQSVYKKEASWFNGNFDVIFSDECHTMTGQAAKQIIEKSSEVLVKIGYTGTVANNFENEMILTGLFGEIYTTTTTADLIKSGINSDVDIKCVRVTHKHNGELKKLTYQQEMNYLLNIDERNEFISKVATKLKGNTLILFQRHSQADAIEKIIRESGRTLYRVDGKVKSEDREHARKSVELLDTQTEESAIILASYPTFQAGINIKNLHNIIFASPTKSMIRIIQSIGRVLRTHHSKDKAIVVDIFDDFEYNGKNKNHTMVHFLERYSIYKQGKFNTTVGNGITIDVSGISLDILLSE